MKLSLADYNPNILASSRRRRSVTFSNTSSLINNTHQQTNILSLSLSSNNNKKLWCTKEDISTFKQNKDQCARLVQQFIARGIAPPIECMIGNEKFLTPHIANQYAARRNKLKHSVLNVSRQQGATQNVTGVGYSRVTLTWGITRLQKICTEPYVFPFLQAAAAA